MNKEEFKEYRKELELTVEELALKLKCSPATIRSYQQGARNLNGLRLERFKELILKNRLDINDTL